MRVPCSLCQAEWMGERSEALNPTTTNTCLLLVQLPVSSRPANPQSTAVGVEASSTPVLNHRRGVYSQRYTQLSNCYYHQDLHHRPLKLLLAGELTGKASVSLYTPLILTGQGTTPQWLAYHRLGGLCTGLGVIHFWSLQLRLVSCYTLLRGFQPSWPPSSYHELQTSFVGSEDEPALWHHTHAFGSPHITSTAYQ